MVRNLYNGLGVEEQSKKRMRFCNEDDRILQSLIAIVHDLTREGADLDLR